MEVWEVMLKFVLGERLMLQTAGLVWSCLGGGVFVLIQVIIAAGTCTHMHTLTLVFSALTPVVSPPSQRR